MGRRYRQKQRKKRNLSEYGINTSHESIEFIRWLNGLGWNPNVNLRLSFFPSTGRGLMSLTPIESNSLLIRVPSNLVITRSKLSNQSNLLSTHDALAQFLIQESVLGQASKWFHYIQSLPKTYDVPFFIPEEGALSALPSFWKDTVLKQREKLGKDYRVAWAYFTVNTRAVYHSDGGMALIPYLDMFNHSSHVSVSIKEISDGSYDIYSGSQTISRYNQVFINYGPHNNIKLFLEYGFWIPHNPHDSIPVSLDDLLEALHPSGCSHLSKKKELIMANKLNQNMCLAISKDEEGPLMASPSWNIYACFDILKCDELPPSSLVMNQIFRDNLEKDNRDLVMSLMTRQLRELKASANALKNSFHYIRSCCMASELLLTYVCAIETALFFFQKV